MNEQGQQSTAHLKRRRPKTMLHMIYNCKSDSKAAGRYVHMLNPRAPGMSPDLL